MWDLSLILTYRDVSRDTVQCHSTNQPIDHDQRAATMPAVVARRETRQPVALSHRKSRPALKSTLSSPHGPSPTTLPSWAEQLTGTPPHSGGVSSGSTERTEGQRQGFVQHEEWELRTETVPETYEVRLSAVPASLRVEGRQTWIQARQADKALQDSPDPLPFCILCGTARPSPEDIRPTNQL